MERRKFIKTAAIGVPLAGQVVESLANNNENKKNMKTIVFRENTRGKADYGWLKANYSFSFANYFDRNRMHFGTLRVLNDDHIEGGGGFPMHPHDNMEIVTIPLKGALEHKDSKGNHGVIKANDVQIMSAGTGIHHSEFNHSKDEDVNLFQIWVYPKNRNINPRYDQKTYKAEQRRNKLQMLVSPKPSDNTLWINQDAYFSRLDLDNHKQFAYKINHQGNGVYLLVVSGMVKVGDETLSRRDAIGVFDCDSFEVSALENAELLFIEIPMDVKM